jgi:hypothetical protein
MSFSTLEQVQGLPNVSSLKMVKIPARSNPALAIAKGTGYRNRRKTTGTSGAFAGLYTVQPKERVMKIECKSAIAAMLLLGGAGVAAAQDVVIAPEQETVIREYVVKQQVQPIAPPPDVEITVGSTLPDTVEVQALEVPDIQTKYSYVVLDGRTVLVDPGTRKIVHIIQ